MYDADPELLSRLLDEHSAALVLYAQQWCDVPEDVVQVAFIKLMQQRPLPINVVGWLYQVVRNAAISESRAATRRVRHEISAAEQRGQWFKTSLNEAMDADAVAAALESLPIEEREVIVLRLWSGRTFEEIAELIGKSTSTAHRRFEMGLEALRKACGYELKQGTQQ